jgi:hypothetical protein
MDTDPRVRAYGSLSLRPDGILHAVFDFEIDPSLEEAAAYLEARRELVGSKVPPVLLEIVKIPYVERHIRSYFMSEMEPPPCRAVVATDPSYVTLWRSFQLVDPADVPSELFRTVDRAVEWIKAQTAAT